MDFESVAGELYGMALDEFTACRDARAAEAKAAGDKELAARIKALRKPTRSAWLVNRLARQRPAQLGELEELGSALRQAHASLAGDELRALSRRRQELVRALTEQAREVADVAVSESMAREVSQTFEAALSDPEAASVVAQGRLTAALAPGDVFAGDWLPAESAGGLDLRKQAREAAEERAAERREAEEAARVERERLEQARAAAKAARAARDEARKRLRTAERAEAKAREATAEAREALAAAEREVTEAEAVVTEQHG